MINRKSCKNNLRYLIQTRNDDSTSLFYLCSIDSRFAIVGFRTAQQLSLWTAAGWPKAPSQNGSGVPEETGESQRSYSLHAQGEKVFAFTPLTLPLNSFTTSATSFHLKRIIRYPQKSSKSFLLE